MKTLTTYKNYPDSPETTSWAYNSRGFMISKTYPDNKSVTYTYDADGKILTRTWSRGITTTYAYNSAGDLISVDYSDSTPDITYTRDRLGRISSVTDAAGTRTFTYNPDSTVATETITGIYNKTLTYTYDTLGRRTSLSLDDGYSVTYSYDSAGRLNTLTSGSDTFTYTYIQGSSLPANITYPNNITVNYTYKPQTNLVASIENKHNTTTISKYSYTYNDRDQRIKVTLSDGSYWEYTYDEMGQLISAVKYDSSGNAIPGHTFDYNFDTIGNRITSRKDAETQSYVSNELNQYTEIQDSQDTTNPSYDDDGNLLYDGRFTYTWNGENRLITIQSSTLKLEFTYDYKGRRIEKKVYENGVLTKHELFIYDGFKCIEKLDALNSNEPIRKYVWQGEQLLSVSLSDSSIYYAFSDANKNITEYVDFAGAMSAHYEYSPFGKVIASTGTIATNFNFRFSSEYSDDETDLIYYNYRYYSPELGRWLSRDPMEEDGGMNVYIFSGNNPIDLIDILGLKYGGWKVKMISRSEAAWLMWDLHRLHVKYYIDSHPGQNAEIARKYAARIITKALGNSIMYHGFKGMLTAVSKIATGGLGIPIKLSSIF